MISMTTKHLIMFVCVQISLTRKKKTRLSLITFQHQRCICRYFVCSWKKHSSAKVYRDISFENHAKQLRHKGEASAYALHLVRFFTGIHRPTFFGYVHIYCTLQYAENERGEVIECCNSVATKKKKERASLTLYIITKSHIVKG
jgi:hypothetical protein